MVNLAVVGSFVFFMICLVADFHEISNRFFKFLWNGSETNLQTQYQSFASRRHTLMVELMDIVRFSHQPTASEFRLIPASRRAD